ncbi:putative F-box domain-containing protein [Neospora caninum Liverpool]|uniref:Putative F-box domain-containing protein n=1 Tax=Neospora caninum (strain Liverpool) TaxID=572307 RepID=F0VRE6_NEOCL|nr:putative F-box domain-containing protein [Neospora caninum Liverpool]CBZ56294.1 putative F-box domain-containing protein [Neospora caninum Liverpool]|eukprot:XP_003886319.1 putative F-box domain-containing protein [Neospora caninum Liverpool]
MRTKLRSPPHSAFRGVSPYATFTHAKREEVDEKVRDKEDMEVQGKERKNDAMFGDGESERGRDREEREAPTRARQQEPLAWEDDASERDAFCLHLLPSSALSLLLRFLHLEDVCRLALSSKQLYLHPDVNTSFAVAHLELVLHQTAQLRPPPGCTSLASNARAERPSVPTEASLHRHPPALSSQQFRALPSFPLCQQPCVSLSPARQSPHASAAPVASFALPSRVSQQPAQSPAYGQLRLCVPGASRGPARGAVVGGNRDRKTGANWSDTILVERAPREKREDAGQADRTATAETRKRQTFREAGTRVGERGGLPAYAFLSLQGEAKDPDSFSHTFPFSSRSRHFFPPLHGRSLLRSTGLSPTHAGGGTPASSSGDGWSPARRSGVCTAETPGQSARRGPPEREKADAFPPSDGFTRESANTQSGSGATACSLEIRQVQRLLALSPRGRTFRSCPLTLVQEALAAAGRRLVLDRSAAERPTEPPGTSRDPRSCTSSAVSSSATSPSTSSPHSDPASPSPGFSSFSASCSRAGCLVLPSLPSPLLRLNSRRAAGLAACPGHRSAEKPRSSRERRTPDQEERGAVRRRALKVDGPESAAEGCAREDIGEAPRAGAERRKSGQRQTETDTESRLRERDEIADGRDRRQTGLGETGRGVSDSLSRTASSFGALDVSSFSCSSSSEVYQSSHHHSALRRRHRPGLCGLPRYLFPLPLALRRAALPSASGSAFPPFSSLRASPPSSSEGLSTETPVAHSLHRLLANLHHLESLVVESAAAALPVPSVLSPSSTPSSPLSTVSASACVSPAPSAASSLSVEATPAGRSDAETRAARFPLSWKQLLELLRRNADSLQKLHVELDHLDPGPAGTGFGECMPVEGLETERRVKEEEGNESARSADRRRGDGHLQPSQKDRRLPRNSNSPIVDDCGSASASVSAMSSLASPPASRASSRLVFPRLRQLTLGRNPEVYRHLVERCMFPSARSCCFLLEIDDQAEGVASGLAAAAAFSSESSREERQRDAFFVHRPWRGRDREPEESQGEEDCADGHRRAETLFLQQLSSRVWRRIEKLQLIKLTPQLLELLDAKTEAGLASLKFEIAHLDVSDPGTSRSAAAASSALLSSLSCLSLGAFAAFLNRHPRVYIHFNRFTVFVRTRHVPQLQLLAKVLGQVEVSQNLR